MINNDPSKTIKKKANKLFTKLPEAVPLLMEEIPLITELLLHRAGVVEGACLEGVLFWS